MFTILLLQAAQGGNDSVDTLKWVAPLTVAVAALIQPWAAAAWNRYIRQASIDVYETGLIDVGFSMLGPTMGLQGTLRAVHHDQFIRSVDLTVTRVADGARHEFEWVGFRAPNVAVPGISPSSASVELPAGFMLTTAEPRRFNIVFADRELERQLRTILQSVGKEWTTELLAAWGGAFPQQMDPAQFRGVSENTYRAFSQEKSYLDAYTELDRLCYWAQGEYRIEMAVETARPSRSFVSSWRFQLNSEDANRLRLNRLNMLQSTCVQETPQFNFAYVDFMTN